MNKSIPLYVAVKPDQKKLYIVTQNEKSTISLSGKHKRTFFHKLSPSDINTLKKYICEEKIIVKTGKCPEDKEISIKSGRCVKKCKTNQERNINTGRCRVAKVKAQIREEKNRTKIRTNTRVSTKDTNLPVIYLSNEQRSIFAKNVNYGLTKVHKLPMGKQCIMSKGENQLKEYLTVGKLLGTGDWGNVYTSCIPKTPSSECTDDDYRFAIKMSRIEPHVLKTIYNPNQSAWHEVLIMKNILTPLVEHGVCPNVPLLMDSFICDNCSFTLHNQRQEHPCIIMITELAGGDFVHFVEKTNPSEKELYSALFQIMAGLHAIQGFGQIMNYDVKGANVLYFNVVPGGYWHYVIHGRDFYVPNYGKLFVLNDFGVSQTFSPDFQYSLNIKDKEFELGSRFAMDIGGIFSPIVATQDYIDEGTGFLEAEDIIWINDKGKKNKVQGSQYMLIKSSQKIMNSDTQLSPEQINYLKKHNLSTNPLDKSYFLQPLVIPPMEYYNDTQDAIRMFTGGKRTTQNGTHDKPRVVTRNMLKKLKVYLGKTKEASDNKFNTNASQTLAGRFIENFFINQINYTTPLSGTKHGDFVMSTY